MVKKYKPLIAIKQKVDNSPAEYTELISNQTIEETIDLISFKSLSLKPVTKIPTGKTCIFLHRVTIN